MGAQDGVATMTKLSLTPVESRLYKAIEHVCFIHNYRQCQGAWHTVVTQKTFSEYA